MLSVLIKAEPAHNYELKKQYEDVNLKKNKPPAEHQGHIIYSLKLFADIQNLVRLSL